MGVGAESALGTMPKNSGAESALGTMPKNSGHLPKISIGVRVKKSGVSVICQKIRNGVSVERGCWNTWEWEKQRHGRGEERT